MAMPQYVSNKGAFDQFASSMQGAANRYNPIIETGNQARDLSMGQYQNLIKNNPSEQYNRLVSNPNAVQDQVAQGFAMSPYQKYLQDMVSKRMNYNSANTGMLGSGAANRALMDELTKMTGQFQNQYIDRGMQSYGQGLSGLEGQYSKGLSGLDSLNNLGFKGMGSQDSMLEQAYGGTLKGAMSENETNQRNAEMKYMQEQKDKSDNAGMWGGILSGAGTIAGNIFGGPMGGQIGGFLGNKLGGMFNSGGGGGSSPSALPSTGNWSF